MQSGPFPKKVGNPPVWKPPGLASLKTDQNWFFQRVFRDSSAGFWLLFGYFLPIYQGSISLTFHRLPLTTLNLVL